MMIVVFSVLHRSTVRDPDRPTTNGNFTLFDFFLFFPFCFPKKVMEDTKSPEDTGDRIERMIVAREMRHCQEVQRRDNEALLRQLRQRRQQRQRRMCDLRDADADADVDADSGWQQLTVRDLIDAETTEIAGSVEGRASYTTVVAQIAGLIRRSAVEEKEEEEASYTTVIQR